MLSDTWYRFNSNIIRSLLPFCLLVLLLLVFMLLLCISSADHTFVMLEEFPVKLLSEIYTHSGHNSSRAIVMLFEYGPEFSGAGKDIFRESRATGEPSQAHTSNFLHPTFYYYKNIPAGVFIIYLRAYIVASKQNILV